MLSGKNKDRGFILPYEGGDSPTRKLRPSSKPKAKIRLPGVAGMKLASAQLATDGLAKKLQRYALDSRQYSPREIKSLIDEIRGNVLSLNVHKKMLLKRKPNKRRTS